MTIYLAICLLLIPCLVHAAELPSNSHPNAFGRGWTCNRGYYKSGESCEKVILPENATLNYLGSGWMCNRGYYKSGERCEKVILPENATLNYLGSGWMCNRGYKASNNACVPMTSEELQKQSELEQAILKKIKERKRQGVRGEDCETEYRTNAQVCVNVARGELDCNKDYSGKYYSDCDATIRYDVETDYSGGAYLDVDVECRVEIEYSGRRTYLTGSDSGRKDESHTLHAYGSTFHSALMMR